MSVLMHTYQENPIKIHHAKGSCLVDRYGNSYVDMVSGLGVNALGYGEEGLLAALEETMKKYLHLSNLFQNEEAEELGQRLCTFSKMKSIFFCNSGTEANEGAIKLAREYGRKKKEGKTKILSSYTGFHGRTMGSIALTPLHNLNHQAGEANREAGYFIYNDIENFKTQLGEDVCGVILEVVQGSGGLNTLSKEFYEEVMQLSREQDFLVIIDEVQTGMGRTGRLFAHEIFSQRPHIITLAKAIGGGLPLGAVLAADSLGELFQVGSHGSTFGGNPVSCKGGSYLLSRLMEDGLLLEVKQKGDFLKNGLEEKKREYPDLIQEVKGQGLMLGIKLSESCFQGVRDGLLERGYYINTVGKDIIRLLPPLTIEKAKLEAFLVQLGKTLEDIREK